MRSKNQQTWAKKEREQRVKAKRARKAERKQEKKDAAAAALLAEGEGLSSGSVGEEAARVEGAEADPDV